MTTENKLKEYILSQYKSVREFCIANDFAYSTVDSMFKRGIMGSSVSLVIKICDRLGIDVDELVNGKIVKKDADSVDCEDISARYSRLDTLDRAKAEAFIDGLLSSDKYSGGGNIPQDIESTLNLGASIQTPTKQK